MEHLWVWLGYLRDHPGAAVGGAVVLAVLYWLLNRRPAMKRDADARLDELRRDRGDYYNRQRPPR